MAELEALTAVLTEIQTLGASLMVLSPQVQRTPREPADQAPLALRHLHDRGNQVASRYGLTFTLPEDLRRVYLGFGLDLARAHGEDSWTLPMPARFVVDRDGMVWAADVDPDYTWRTEPAATLAALRALRR